MDDWDLLDTDEKSIGHIAGYPAHGKWNAWVTEQGEVWVDRFNEVFLIKNMSERYAYNVLRFVWLNHRDDLGENPRANPLIIALVARLKGSWSNTRLNYEFHTRSLVSGKVQS